MAEATPRLGLPFIIPGQAQKELFHNEALMLLDLAVHPVVEAAPLASPPAAPVPGQCWLVGAGAGGEWTGRESHLAMWSESGWRFFAPREGMAVWQRDVRAHLHYLEGAWGPAALSASALRVGGQQVVGPRLPAVPNPSGGTIIDAEARAAINQLIATLLQHGLTE
jgi:hypothetical protein